jgi:hypothetical protein
MSWVEFESMIPILERAKAICALDRLLSVIGFYTYIDWECIIIIKM